jgi:excisionase family DNA binding protein
MASSALEAMLKPQDVAEFLGVPVATLYRWRYEGEGPRAVRVGRHLRYRPAEVEAWLDRGGSRAVR